MPDVLVIGGGPAGAASSIFLAQRGHAVVLVDEARFPRDKVCGEGVSPEAWRLLRVMGVADAVDALRPHPLRGMRLIAPNGMAFQGFYDRSRRPGFAARRAQLDAALLDGARAAGVEVREGVRAGAVTLDGGVARVSVTTTPDDRAQDTGADTNELTARLLVVADGRRSFLARTLGQLAPHRSLRKFAVRGYWEGVEGLGEHGEMHVGGGGYCGVAPLSPTEANVAFVLDAHEMTAAGGDLVAFYLGALRRWPHLCDRLGAGRLVAPPKAVGPLALVARRLSVGNAVLVGDAAGFYDPFTGEGITLALRSAEMAAEAGHAFLTGAARDLRAYDRAREEATRQKFRLNRILQRVVAWPTLANAVAGRLACRQDLADMLVGIAGDYVPARHALGPRFLWRLLAAPR